MKLISNRMFWNIPKIFFHDIEITLSKTLCELEHQRDKSFSLWPNNLLLKIVTGTPGSGGTHL